MRRLLTLLCSLLAALGLPACDDINARELRPGISTALDVRDRYGPPQMEWPNDDGSVTWEYSRQPQGAECYMITIGPDQILRRLDQVLNEATFARVQPGMSTEDVRRMLGKPASSQFFQLKQETVWEWLIERGSTLVEPVYFTVSFNTEGRVVSTGRYTRMRG